MLLFNTNSANLRRVLSLKISLSSFSWSLFPRADKHSLCGIFGYIIIASASVCFNYSLHTFMITIRFFQTFQYVQIYTILSNNKLPLNYRNCYTSLYIQSNSLLMCSLMLRGNTFEIFLSASVNKHAQHLAMDNIFL